MNSASLDGYSAVRDGGAGLLDLSTRGRLVVAGSEAVMFLNGLITNDIKTLGDGNWMTAAFPNVQGRLLAVVRIINRQGDFLIDTEMATREKVLHLLDRFTMAGDFRVTDVTDQTATLSLQGSGAAQIVRSLFGADAATINASHVWQGAFAAAEVTIIRATHSGEDGFDLFVDRKDLDTLRDELIKAGAQPVGAESAEVLRLEAGLPRYGIDMDETTIVTETNLEHAVSYTKGCYVGQEIIVRIKHRGHVAKKITGILSESETVFEPNTKILSRDDKEIGWVSSSVFSPRLGRAIALGYVKYDYLAPGTEVKIGGTAGAVAELPLVHGSWGK